MDLDYILRKTDKEEFNLNCKDYGKVLRPTSIESKWIEEKFKLETPIGVIYFSPEPPGLQVSFRGSSDSEDYSGSKEYAKKICQEILESIEIHTGEKGEIVEL